MPGEPQPWELPTPAAKQGAPDNPRVQGDVGDQRYRDALKQRRAKIDAVLSPCVPAVGAVWCRDLIAAGNAVIYRFFTAFGEDSPPE